MWSRNGGKFLLIALTAGALTGCGGQAYRADDGSDTSGTAVDTTQTSVVSDTDTSEDSTTNFTASETYSFSVSGPSGTNPKFETAGILTDSVLLVKIRAESAGNLSLSSSSQYSNFSAQYRCVRYTVSALGSSVQTQVLSPDGGSSLCPNAPAEQTIDFRKRLMPGHGPVTISVVASGYDFYCQMAMSACMWSWDVSSCYYYAGCNMNAPIRTVYKTHTVTGTLEIQTNGANQ